MRQSMPIIGLAVALVVATTGCAAHGRSDLGAALPRPEGSASANGADLQGTWRGSFGQVMTGDSGQIHGEIVCEINGDGTYKTTWTTRLVAGSTRGGRLQRSGTVTGDASRVVFDDSSSGSRMTLRRDGDTLYGVTIDPLTKRVSVAVELHKAQPAPESP